MATFEDCGHGKQVWMAMKDFKKHKIVASGDSLIGMTAALGYKRMKKLVFTRGCIQCELASTRI